MKKRKLLGVLSAAVMGVTMLPSFSASAASVGQKLYVGNGSNQQKGNCDGYSYEVWLDTTGGSGSMTLGSGCTFKAEWSASVSRGNFLARRGLDFGSQKKATDYGYIGMDYKADYKQTGSASGNSRLCVYGWFQNRNAGNVPLVEYYIIEDWVDWCPDGNGKMVTIDGAQYKIFQMDHTGPSINSGNETFKQYFSVRQSKRTSGHITVSDHFKAWAQQGWGIGNLYEVALNAEGWQSSGYADVTELDVYTDERSTSSGTGTTQQYGNDYAEPDSKGYYFNETFENGKGNATGRSSESIDVVGDYYADGGKSAYVSGRSAEWNGLSVPINLEPGKSYSIGAAVLATSSSTPFKISMQYNDTSGNTNYTDVATATGNPGAWKTISNSSFTVPSGASNISVYVETESGTDNFYVDNFFCAKSGTAAVNGNAKANDGSVTTNDNPDYTGGGDKSSATWYPGKDADRSSPYLRKAFGNFFRIGTSVSPNELNGSTGQNFIKNHFNSITPENALKPEAIIDQGNSSGTNTAISLYQVGSTMQFCQNNGIGMRGHTFVWYSQTPDWFFRENYSSNGNYVSSSTMDARLESMIKNTFSAIKSQYPKLDLYSYDVCNELFVNDGGGLRPSNNSNWVRVYGGDSFVAKAFQYARKYAPEDCKLYVNDYNEYMSAKTNDIYSIATKVKSANGCIDGIGMQSHLDTSYPDKNTYNTALQKFISSGLDVQITELDITCSDFNAQASLYADIFKLAVDNQEHIPALTVWGTHDSISWRGSQNPLIFGSNYSEKPAYKAVLAVASSATVPQTTTTTTTTTTKTTTTTTKTTSKTTSTTKVSYTVLGDANNDGKVSIADAVLVSRYANESSVSMSAVGLANADANKDGVIDFDDASLILKKIARLITLR